MEMTEAEVDTMIKLLEEDQEFAEINATNMGQLKEMIKRLELYNKLIEFDVEKITAKNG